MKDPKVGMFHALPAMERVAEREIVPDDIRSHMSTGTRVPREAASCLLGHRPCARHHSDDSSGLL